MSLAGTVILALLGGLGGAVLAQDMETPASDGPHPVSGSLRADTGCFQGSTLVVEEGRTQQRGYGCHDAIEMDDARLSGTLWHVWNRDFIGERQYGREGEVLTGTVELVNDDGSWVGTMRGYYTMDPRTAHWHLELTGTGAHDGFSALLYTKGLDTMDVEGFVFPGVLPEYPDPVVVPTE